MSSVPLYLQGKGGRGRGRGRGRGDGGGGGGASARPPPVPQPGGLSSSNNNGSTTAAPSFLGEQISQQHGLAEDNEVLVGGSANNEVEAEPEVAQKAVQAYAAALGDAGEGTTGTSTRQHRDFLEEFCQPGSNACLICLEDIENKEPVWNCNTCFEMYHMGCIQHWIRDGVQHAKLSDELFPDQRRPWYCPKCRCEYEHSEFPAKYKCFCAKEVEPKFDPWITPHSCGELCDKLLKPHCGHTCVMLCHPGACPPCPHTVKDAPCHCGKEALMKRCGDKHWSCSKPCNKLLSCGTHRCKQICHDGKCLECPQTSMQSCTCGKESKIVACAAPAWSCSKPCGKLFGCGHHSCEKICCPGDCGECPRAQRKTCPCGKTPAPKGLPCTDEAPRCHNTCEKKLDCGHSCPEKCHPGDCPQCRHVVKKTCRCTKSSKEMLCLKPFVCSKKCTDMKDCGRHACKRKCCLGPPSCPPCNEVCNYRLKCGNHKCQATCHSGPCYPCPLTKTVACACGQTTKTVPCGREKTARPPKCSLDCKLKSKCSHPSQIPHPCHFGACPPCVQPCTAVHDGCGHVCGKPCHEGTPCPPCTFPVDVVCLGLHATVTKPCNKSGKFACGKPCARLLPCGRHACEKRCHAPQDTAASWEELDSKADGGGSGGCGSCEKQCAVVRPAGCRHNCPLKWCHMGECPPCKKMTKVKCHCGGLTFNFQCDELLAIPEAEKSEKLSCKDRCPKTLEACGHPCKLKCHLGPCSDPKECKKKMVTKCKCGMKTETYLCGGNRRPPVSLECDSNCNAAKLANAAPVQDDDDDDDDDDAGGSTGGDGKGEVRNRGDGKKRRQQRRAEREAAAAAAEAARQTKDPNVAMKAVVAVVAGLVVVWLLQMVL